MKSKSPLALMEQVVMVLIFALAAALCVRVFAFTHQASLHYNTRDQAVLAAQTVTETLKATGGDMAYAQSKTAQLLGGVLSQGVLYVNYDENWIPVSGEDNWRYRLYVQEVPAPTEGLQQARIWIDDFRETSSASDAPLFELTVAWQEVSHE